MKHVIAHSLSRGKLQAASFVLVFCLSSPYSGARAQSAVAPSGKPKPDAVFLVGGKSIRIPSPAADMAEYGSDKGNVESFVPPYNRLIAAFVPNDAKGSFISVDHKAPSRLVLVQVPRDFESTEIDASFFQGIIDQAAKGFDTSVESYAKENEEEFNQKLESLGLNDAKIAFDKPIPLGIFFAKPNAVAFGTIVRASAGSASLTKAVILVYMRVKNRVLFAYFFEDYKDRKTVLELRKTTQDWADAILNVNQQ